ncbi:hypothetical protein CFOL_v3_35176 [Cephalotus follicularis]|uniref:DUF4283 domain-containing protein n=1 Tax=Cephalotus follicularis TaxID=3775 RepID=A0A1Q3DH18_CEPFO|nr:hypothetical protein CFOL_v3_35176 [Cephalotus follicularis]
MKHPMAPRICVEMDLAYKLPDEVVIAIGTDEAIHQKIEYDLRIGFCIYCHLQGHHETNCRKKQLQTAPTSADPTSSSLQGNASILNSNVAVVSAALPAGVRPRARYPNKTPVTDPPSPSEHPPAACVNTSTNLSCQPCLQSSPIWLLPDAATPPTLPTADPQSSHPAQSLHISPQNPGSPHIPPAPPLNSSVPPPSSPLVQTLDSDCESQPIVIQNQFSLLTDDNVLVSQPVLDVPSLHPSPNAQANSQPFPLPTISSNPTSDSPQPLSAALVSLPSDSPPPIPPPETITQVSFPPPLHVLDYASPVIACSRAAQAFITSPALQTLRTLPCPLDRPQHILPTHPGTSCLAICDTPSASHQICTLNAEELSISPFDRELSISPFPSSISSAPKRASSPNPPKKTKTKGRPKGNLSSTKNVLPLHLPHD